MKHIMKSKMNKNETFYVSKVLKGDNHFLRRQVTTADGLRGARPQRASNASRKS